MNILIADDDKIARSLLKFQLEHWGYSVLTAENGVQAWQILQSKNCPIVITDWQMPEMNGIELIQKIRAAQREEYVYVILLTSNSERQAMVTGLTTGADDFLTKPVNVEELRARLQPGLRIIDLERRLAERHRELEARNHSLYNANAKMKRNLDAAAQIQKAFLPSQVLGVPEVQFAWHYSPCDELAGDMLNVIKLDDNHLGVYVLDVSGHGVQAALLAVTVCRYLSSQKDASSVLWHREDGSADYQLLSPAAVVRRLNDRMISQSLYEQYFTLAYGILDRRTGEFRYTLAGHPPPIHLTADGRATFLAGEGLPIGITEFEYDEHVIELRTGDRLLLYSDGVTECMNAADQQFGNERLTAACRRSSDWSLDAIISQVLGKVTDWRCEAPIHDDLSLLALQFEPQNSGQVFTRSDSLTNTDSNSLVHLSVA